MNLVTFRKQLSPNTEEEDGDVALSEYDEDNAKGDRKINPHEELRNNSAITTTENADLPHSSNFNKSSKILDSKSNIISRNHTTTDPDSNYIHQQTYVNSNSSDITILIEEGVSKFEYGQTVINVPFSMPNKYPSLEDTFMDNALESESNVADKIIQKLEFGKKNYSTSHLFSLLTCSSKGIIMTYPMNLREPYSLTNSQSENESPYWSTKGSRLETGKVYKFGNDAVFVSPSRKCLLNLIDNLSSEGKLSNVLNKMSLMITKTTFPGDVLDEVEEEKEDITPSRCTELEPVTNMQNITGADNIKDKDPVTITLERDKRICKALLRSNELTLCNSSYCEIMGLSKNVYSVLVGVNNSVTARSWKNKLRKRLFCCGPANNVAFIRHARYLFLNKINDEANCFCTEIANTLAQILTGTNRGRDELDDSDNTAGVQIDATKASVDGLDLSSFKLSKSSDIVKDNRLFSHENNTKKKATQLEPSKVKLKQKKKKLKTTVKDVNKEPLTNNNLKSYPDSTVSTNIIIGHTDSNTRNDVSPESKSAKECKYCKSADSTFLILKRIKSSFDLTGWSAPLESQDILSSTEALHPFKSNYRKKETIQYSSSVYDHFGQEVTVKGSSMANKLGRKKQKKEPTPARSYSKKSRTASSNSLETERVKFKDAVFKLKNTYGHEESNQILGGRPMFVTFLKAKSIQPSETSQALQSIKHVKELYRGSSECLKHFPMLDHCRQKSEYHEVSEITYVSNKLNEIWDSDAKYDRSDSCIDAKLLSGLQRVSNKYLHNTLDKQKRSQRKVKIVFPHITNISNPWTILANHDCDLKANYSDFSKCTPVESMNDNSNTNFHLLNGNGLYSSQHTATSKFSKSKCKLLPPITNVIANTQVSNKEVREEIKLPPVHNAKGNIRESALTLMTKDPFLSVTSLKASMLNENIDLNNGIQSLIGVNQEEESDNKRHLSKCRTQIMPNHVRKNVHFTPLTHRQNSHELIVTAKSFPKLDVIQVHNRNCGSAHHAIKCQLSLEQHNGTKDTKSHHYIKRRQSPKWHQYANSQVLNLSKAPLSDTQGVVESLKDEDVGLVIRGLYSSQTFIKTEYDIKSREVNQLPQSYAVNLPLERSKKRNIRQARWPFSKYFFKTFKQQPM